jgi:hypothetical protein
LLPERHLAISIETINRHAAEQIGQ